MGGGGGSNNINNNSNSDKKISHWAKIWCWQCYPLDRDMMSLRLPRTFRACKG
jgi:hypothetical protein